MSPHPHSVTTLSPRPKKRPLSTAAGENDDDSDLNDPTASGRLNSISSLLNHAQLTGENIPLDPKLMATNQHQEEQSDRESFKAERRAKLQQEAELMRDILRAKEKELAELG